MKRILFIALSCLIIISVVNYANLFDAKKNEIDHFTELFDPVKKVLDAQTGQSAISLITDENNLELYYQLQFILTPHIIEHQNTTNDTIIIMKKNGTERPALPFDQYNILYTASGTLYWIMVLSKKH